MRDTAGARALRDDLAAAGSVRRRRGCATLELAQIALFESDHLGGIHQAERLEYRFAREAAGANAGEVGSYTDRVDIDVRPRADGGKDVWTDFLSAEHHVPFPPLMDFHGNPVTMFSSSATSTRCIA